MTENERKAYQAGQRDMRTRAAKLCGDKARAIDPYNSAGTRGEIMKPTYEECERQIRDLEIKAEIT
jgi:hypothetical protein